jgi:hypothetical protein
MFHLFLFFYVREKLSLGAESSWIRRTVPLKDVVRLITLRELHEIQNMYNIKVSFSYARKKNKTDINGAGKTSILA